jgi:hypothetical protein
LDSISESIETTIRQLDALATTIVSSAQNTNQTFPFVTIEHYSIQVAKSTSVTGIIKQTSLLPIVGNSQLLEWEVYSAPFSKHLKHWISDAIQIQKSHWYSDDNVATTMNDNYINRYNESLNVSHVIENWESYALSAQDMYLPGWQTFPLLYDGGSYKPAGK